MVKFSKQFEGQLIPEWKEAFVDYWQLKKDLKRIHFLNNINTTPNNQQISSVVKSPFSLLTKFSLFCHQQRDHEPIQVNFFIHFEDIRF
jgi:SPX domain protein involved in polyphosphate accumulation